MNKLSEQYHGGQDQPKKGKKEPIKITYISSPTMFKATNASEFRAIVQEFTGKDSKFEDHFGASSVITNEDASTQVPHYGTPEFHVEGVQRDVLSNNPSRFLQTEDSLFWGDVLERSFELQSQCVYV